VLFVTKTLPTKYRPALSRTEGQCRFFATLRADRVGFNSGVTRIARARRRRSEHGDSLRFACLTALGFIFELLVMEKQLLACSEDEVCAAVNTLQHPVLEFHRESSFGPTHRRERTAQIVAHKCVILAPSISTATLGSAHRTGKVCGTLLTKKPSGQ